MNELKLGSYVIVKDVKKLREDAQNKAILTAGKPYYIKETFLSGGTITNDVGDDFYIGSYELQHVQVLDADDSIIQYIKQLESANKEVKLENPPLGAEIKYKDARYKRVGRLAQEGDLVVYPEIDSTWFHTGIESNTPYPVVDNGDDALEIEVESGWYYVYGGSKYDNEQAVQVYELVDEKTTNQKRGQIIQEAKDFLENVKQDVQGRVVNGSQKGQIVTNKGVYTFLAQHEGREVHAVCKVEFIIHEEKGRVIALMRGVDTGKVYARGIAQCVKGDVFNIDLGKAIAVGKAMKLDVSKFMDAPYPNGIHKGMVVSLRMYPHMKYVVLDGKAGNSFWIKNIKSPSVGKEWEYTHNLIVEDDTGVVYK